MPVRQLSNLSGDSVKRPALSSFRFTSLTLQRGEASDFCPLTADFLISAFRFFLYVAEPIRSIHLFSL
jgi:hypothetical protein